MARTKSLQYHITEKQGYLILSIAGALKKECWTSLGKLMSELHEKHPDYIILTLGDVSLCEESGIEGLIQLQAQARKEAKAISLCQLQPQVLNYLRSHHAIEETEIEEDLLVALSRVAKRSVKVQNDNPRL